MSNIDFDNPYPTPRVPPPIEVSPIPAHLVNFPRPKSTPSTIGPNVEDLLFAENPFRIRNEEYPPFTFPLSPAPSNKGSSPYFGAEYHHGSQTARSSPNRHHPIPIAPDPVGLRQLNALKRVHDEEFAEYGQRKRRTFHGRTSQFDSRPSLASPTKYPLFRCDSSDSESGCGHGRTPMYVHFYFFSCPSWSID